MDRQMRRTGTGVVVKTPVVETLGGRYLPRGWMRDTSSTGSMNGMPEAPAGLSDSARHPSLSGLLVVESIESYGDERWHHGGVSRPDRLPSWEDIKLVRRLFIWTDREAHQVLPPDSEYVNRHPFVLHLWRPLDRLRVVPEFMLMKA